MAKVKYVCESGHTAEVEENAALCCTPYCPEGCGPMCGPMQVVKPESRAERKGSSG